MRTCCSFLSNLHLPCFCIRIYTKLSPETQSRAHSLHTRIGPFLKIIRFLTFQGLSLSTKKDKFKFHTPWEQAQNYPGSYLWTKTLFLYQRTNFALQHCHCHCKNPTHPSDHLLLSPPTLPSIYFLRLKTFQSHLLCRNCQDTCSAQLVVQFLESSARYDPLCWKYTCTNTIVSISFLHSIPNLWPDFGFSYAHHQHLYCNLLLHTQKHCSEYINLSWINK